MGAKTESINAAAIARASSAHHLMRKQCRAPQDTLPTATGLASASGRLRCWHATPTQPRPDGELNPPIPVTVGQITPIATISPATFFWIACPGEMRECGLGWRQRSAMSIRPLSSPPESVTLSPQIDSHYVNAFFIFRDHVLSRDDDPRRHHVGQLTPSASPARLTAIGMLAVLLVIVAQRSSSGG